MVGRWCWGKDGVPDFGAVRGAIGKAQHRLVYYAFVRLQLDGGDLRGAALADRSRLRADIIAGEPGNRILLSASIEAAVGADAPCVRARA